MFAKEINFETIDSLPNREFEMNHNFESNIECSTNHYEWCPVLSTQKQLVMSLYAINSDLANIGSNFKFPFQQNLNLMMQMPIMPLMSPRPPVPLMKVRHGLQAKPSNTSRSALNSYNSGNETIVCNQLESKQYFCKLCNSYSSTDIKLFRQHLNLHSGKSRPFVCQICNKSFEYRCFWRNHITNHLIVKYQNPQIFDRKLNSIPLNAVKPYKNNGLKDNKCDYGCREWSQSETYLQTKSFKCSDCDYQSSSKARIQRHYRTHTREKLFYCVKCSSRFALTGSLKGHLAKVHKIDVLSLDCTYCQSFNASNFGVLLKHINRVHHKSPFTYSLLN